MKDSIKTRLTSSRGSTQNGKELKITTPHRARNSLSKRDHKTDKNPSTMKGPRCSGLVPLLTTKTSWKQREGDKQRAIKHSQWGETMPPSTLRKQPRMTENTPTQHALQLKPIRAATVHKHVQLWSKPLLHHHPFQYKFYSANSNPALHEQRSITVDPSTHRRLVRHSFSTNQHAVVISLSLSPRLQLESFYLV